jgi:hypothetical protein
LKVTAAASAQVSKFYFHRAIPGIKLSHLVHQDRLAPNEGATRDKQPQGGSSIWESSHCEIWAVRNEGETDHRR